MQIFLQTRIILPLFLSVIFISPIYAAAEHRFVFGYNGGHHKYYKEDFFGKYSEDNVQQAGEFYAEWYFLERLGIGYRYHLSGFDKIESDDGIETAKSMVTTHSLATLQFLAFTHEDTFKLGLLGGGGQTNFNYKYRKCSGSVDIEDPEIKNFEDIIIYFVRLSQAEFKCDSTIEDRDFSTSGQSSILGAFMDLGWRNFGFRLAYNSILVSGLDDYQGVTPNLSGSGYYMGMWFSF